MGANPSRPPFAVQMSAGKRGDDVYDYEYALRNSLKRLDESEVLSGRDKELIQGFIEHLSAKRVSTGRLAKYAFTVRQLMEHLGVHIENAARKDIEKLSIWVQKQNYSPHTISDSFFAIKYFYKFVRNGNTDRTPQSQSRAR
jgi:hypothetical protein